MQHSCPYCGARPRDSDDHIFPQFLGGKRTIRVCKPCNDRFGHDFEGPVSRDLAPFIVLLRRAGLQAPRLVVWKRALRYGEKQIEYDLDSNLNMSPSMPVFEKEDGITKRVVAPSRKHLKEFTKMFEKSGKKFRVKEENKSGIDIRSLTAPMQIGRGLRRLALKMSVATADLISPSVEVLDSLSRGFLLGDIKESERSRLDFTNHGDLDRLRTPLSHMVYVKGNGTTGRCYSIVSFYGVIQLYSILSDTAFRSQDFAALALLDPVAGYEEEISPGELYMLPEAPFNATPARYEKGLKGWSERFVKEGKAAFGDQFGDATLVNQGAAQWEKESGTAAMTVAICDLGKKPKRLKG